MPENRYELLPPMVAADVDLRAFEFMPLHITKLMRSETWALCRRRPELAFYLMNLWCAAWHEIPAASIPDDDRAIMALAQCPSSRWRYIRDPVLSGWVRCDDGRRYHRAMSELASISWERRLEHRSRAANARLAKSLKKSTPDGSVTGSMTGSMTAPVTGSLPGLKGEGEGERDIRPSPPSAAEPAEGADFQATESGPKPRRANGTNPRANGTNPRALGTNPRAIENRSLEAWRSTVDPIAQVAITGSRPAAERLTWAYVASKLDADPATIAGIKACGSGEFGIGCRNIADRDKFNSALLEQKFRQAYELAATTNGAAS